MAGLALDSAARARRARVQDAPGRNQVMPCYAELVGRQSAREIREGVEHVDACRHGLKRRGHA
jgi:hypothetical protein